MSAKQLHVRRVLTPLLGLLCALALAPSAAQAAGAGVSAAPDFPGAITVGDTNLPAAIVLRNANEAPDNSLTLCNAGDSGKCTTSAGITLTPSCGGQDLSAACVVPDPVVFNVDSPATGAPGTSCAGMSFLVAVINASTGKLRFTPTVGHVVLPNRPTSTAPGSDCRIEFTFDVLKFPGFDAEAGTDGRQTLQIPETLALSDRNNLAFGRGTATGASVKTGPTIATTASPDIAVGAGQLTDFATLGSDFSPTGGHVTFQLFGPSDATCSGTPIFTSSVPINTDGTATSAPYSPTAVGTYHWIASYSGDASNSGVSGACGEANENVNVTEGPPPPTREMAPPPVPVTAPPPPPATTPAPRLEPASGVANISSGGHTGCANKPFRVNVTGEGISRVVFTLDGKPIARLAGRNHNGRYSVRINPAKHKRGTHHVQARITFLRPGGGIPRTERVAFSRCAKSAPRFTG